MIKTRKIRGHRRKWKEIDAWVAANTSLDLAYLKSSERAYVKIWVHPWSGISITESEIAQPNGETKRRMLQGLIDIYDAWKVSLESLKQPYYLRIWLYEPNFSNSQVVCAIGSTLDFYDITFHKPERPKTISTDNYGKLANQLSAFDWEYRWEEFHFQPEDLGEPEEYASMKDYLGEKKWFNRIMNGPLRECSHQNAEGETVEYFAKRLGTVWVGGK